jgi:queuine tRNA-ribosyltransferase
MPVGTAGAMKGITLEDLETLGAQIMLCNTYHLHIRPGEDVVAEAGGLHKFIGWDKPILTDSGGFQVFSLEALRKVTDEGVSFASHLDGTPLFLGPEEAMTIQRKLGADIIMCFDQCPPSKAPRGEIETAVDRTLKWAKECKKVHEQACHPERSRRVDTRERDGSTPLTMTRSPLLFGIIQGGLHRDLRKKCAEELIAIGFDGYAIGGLAVGESEEEMYGVLDDVCPLLPKGKPRYLMGVGRIEQMETAVAKGIDMFDCVLPMREARHGTIYGSDGSKIRILNAQYIHDHSPIDADSPSPLSRRHSKSYLNHLLRSGERLGETIACMQNMGITLERIRSLRKRLE